MARLPQPGGDANEWGDILNDFLSVALNGDGTLKPSAIAGKADDDVVVHKTGDEMIAGTKQFTTPPSIPAPTQAGHATTKAYVDAAVATKADASTVVALAVAL